MGLSAELRIADAGRSPLARGLRWTASTRPGAWVFAGGRAIRVFVLEPGQP